MLLRMLEEPALQRLTGLAKKNKKAERERERKRCYVVWRIDIRVIHGSIIFIE